MTSEWAVEGRVTLNSAKAASGFRLMWQVRLLPRSARWTAAPDRDRRGVHRPEARVQDHPDLRRRRWNIVVSRRRILEEQKGASAGNFLRQHKPGELLPGKVTRIEPLRRLCRDRARHRRDGACLGASLVARRGSA